MKRIIHEIICVLLVVMMLPLTAFGAVPSARDTLEILPQELTAGDSVSDWIAFANGRMDHESDRYLQELEQYVTEQYGANGALDRVKATQWHRIILTVTALGGDATAVNGINLVADGTYQWSQTDSLGTQGLNSWIFALLSLDSRCYAVPEQAQYTRSDMIAAILSAQAEGGGFGLSAGSEDVDITAMALQALAPYRNGTVAYTTADGTSVTVGQSVEKALAYLHAQQRSDGAFNSWGDANAESCAQVVIALCALGMDPQTFSKDGHSAMDGMLMFRLQDGSFCHVKGGGSDTMASEQVALALCAFERFQNGERRLYDCREERSSDVQQAITSLNDKLTSLSDKEVAAQGESLLGEYLAIPAAERSYVTGFDRLAQAVDVPEEDPAQSYDLYVGGSAESHHVWRYVSIGGAAVVIAAVAVLTVRRKKNV